MPRKKKVEDDTPRITNKYLVIVESPSKSKTIEKYSFSKENNEEGEVGDIKWIPISEIGDYKWAFDHDNIIREFLKTRKKKKQSNKLIVRRRDGRAIK